MKSAGVQAEPVPTGDSNSAEPISLWRAPSKAESSLLGHSQNRLPVSPIYLG
jgi:hypothetical protein